jgi:hypothetical protein
MFYVPVTGLLWEFVALGHHSRSLGGSNALPYQAPRVDETRFKPERCKVGDV